MIKYLFIASILLVSFSSHSQVTAQFKKSLYDNCVTKPHDILNGNAKQEFCQCITSNADQLSLKEWSDIGNKTANARFALNKMIIFVNGPCMEMPLFVKTYKACQGQKGTTPALCKCLGQNIARYYTEQTQAKLPNILQNEPNIYDPMALIMNDPDFQAAEKQIALSCATEGLR